MGALRIAERRSSILLLRWLLTRPLARSAKRASGSTRFEACTLGPPLSFDNGYALKLDAERLPAIPFKVISIRLALVDERALPVSLT